MKNEKIRSLVDHRYSQPIICKFTKYWLKHLYPCKNMTLYGFIFPTVPLFSSSNEYTSTLWTLTTLICVV